VGNSQITGATLQASGLTCALCAKSIYTNLTSLSFVESVDTDLNASSFLISFRKNQEFVPGLLKKKVEDAGFSVSNLAFDFDAFNQTVNHDVPVKIGQTFYHVVNIKSKVLNGATKWQIIDKGFVGAKELKKFMSSIKQPCYQTTELADCPDLDDLTSFQTYHVIIK
jgi:copper chaperone CopZ